MHKITMFTLIDLPYAYDALEPVISARTLSFHHGKHLQGYVDNLNELIAGKPFEGMPLEDIIRKAEGGVFNNAGQILNHNLYFTQFCAPHSGLDLESPRAAPAPAPPASPPRGTCGPRGCPLPPAPAAWP